MRTPHVFIEATGMFLPETVSVEDAIEQGLYPTADACSHGLTGAAVAGDLPAPEMALRAARQALDRCARPPGDVSLLLYVDSWHQGPDGWQPQYYLQRHLLGDGALAVELRHGCNGVFSALELAADRLRAGTEDRPVLVTAADNFGTPMMDRWSMCPARPGTSAGRSGTWPPATRRSPSTICSPRGSSKPVITSSSSGSAQE